jgi:hypothetical protein
VFLGKKGKRTEVRGKRHEENEAEKKWDKNAPIPAVVHVQYFPQRKRKVILKNAH